MNPLDGDRWCKLTHRLPGLDGSRENVNAPLGTLGADSLSSEDAAIVGAEDQLNVDGLSTRVISNMVSCRAFPARGEGSNHELSHMERSQRRRCKDRRLALDEGYGRREISRVCVEGEEM